MRDAMAAAALSPPKIRQTTFFTIAFKRPGLKDKEEDTQKKKLGEKVTDRVTEKVTEKVTENQALILKEMNKDNHVTARLLSKFVGISERKIKENIKLLKNRGKLKRIGPARGGYWEVVDSQ
jgi:ATP-dependent DNA helicase RecG